MKTFTFFFLLFTATTFAQKPWVPVGSTWYYSYGVMSPQIYYTKWVCTQDTMVLGKNCSYIKDTVRSYVDGDLFGYNIMYEESGIVYWYNPFQNSFSVLFNFNAKASDTWVTRGDSCDFIVYVDSVSSQIINGKILKVLYISNQDMVDWYGKVIEDIGSINRPTPDYTTYCFGYVTDVRYYMGLRCFSSDSIDVYKTGIAATCDTILDNISFDKTEKSITVFPNPSDKDITISLNGNESIKKVIITNTLGQIVSDINISYGNDRNINVHLPKASGMYFIHLRSETGEYVGKVVRN